MADAVGVGDAVVVEVGDEIVGESSAGEGEEGECEFHIEWVLGFFFCLDKAVITSIDIEPRDREWIKELFKSYAFQDTRSRKRNEQGRKE